jgi:hypothetical protein
MTDGTSNTLLFAEGYSKAGSSSYTDYTASYGAGSYAQYTYSYTRVWNFDPLASNSVTTTRSQSANPRATPPVPYIYEYTATQDMNPTFSTASSAKLAASDTTNSKGGTVPSYTFQVRPAAKDANANLPQATTSGGLLVAMCDGSVTVIAAGIDPVLWAAMGTPSAGDGFGPANTNNGSRLQTAVSR